MSDTVSPEDMATMHDVESSTIYRILRADQKRPESERRLPGAIKEGSKFRGVWKIPRDVAEKWERSPRGRK